MNELLTIIGVLLKFIYITPFINYLLIIKREQKELELKNNYYLISGFLLLILNYLLIIMSNTLLMNKQLNLNFNKLMIYQTVFNLFLMIGYLLLMIGVFKHDNKNFDINDLINIIIITLLITVLSPLNYLFIINSITYLLGIYFLIKSLIIMNNSLKKLQKKYYLTIIGALLLILDPIVFINAYKQALLINSLTEALNVLYFNRLIIYLIGTIAMILILIPNILLFIKLSRRKAFRVTSKDSIIEARIKKLLTKLQETYGEIVINLFNDVCKQFKTNCNKVSDLKISEQKLLFNKLINKLRRTFPKRIINKLLESEGIK